MSPTRVTPVVHGLFYPANFVLSRPFRPRCSRFTFRSRHATDRQTDRQTDIAHYFIMHPSDPTYGCRWHNNNKSIVVSDPDDVILVFTYRYLLRDPTNRRPRYALHRVRPFVCLSVFLSHSGCNSITESCRTSSLAFPVVNVWDLTYFLTQKNSKS